MTTDVQTHCARGHEYTLQNTYEPPGLPGQRRCRTCIRERVAEYKERRKGTATDKSLPRGLNVSQGRMAGAEVSLSNLRSLVHPQFAADYATVRGPKSTTLDELLDRLTSRLAPDDNGCWIWSGVTWSSGRYGHIEVAGLKMSTHVLMLWLGTGVRPPAGFDVDHLCRVTLCGNPWHLQAVTSRENKLRGVSPVGVNARKTHCVRGHEFTPENTYRPPGNPSQRNCRTCKAAARDAERRAR